MSDSEKDDQTLKRLCQSLPFELQHKILLDSFEGAVNKAFREFEKENDLWRYNVYINNFKPNPHYTLAQFLKDCRHLKRINMWVFEEDAIFDVAEVLAFLLDHHVMEDADSDDESDYDSDGNSSDESVATESDGEDELLDLWWEEPE